MRKARDNKKKMQIEKVRLKMVGCPTVCCVEKVYHIRPTHVLLDRFSNVDGDSEYVDATALRNGRGE